MVTDQIYGYNDVSARMNAERKNLSFSRGYYPDDDSISLGSLGAVVQLVSDFQDKGYSVSFNDDEQGVGSIRSRFSVPKEKKSAGLVIRACQWGVNTEVECPTLFDAVELLVNYLRQGAPLMSKDRNTYSKKVEGYDANFRDFGGICPFPDEYDV